MSWTKHGVGSGRTLATTHACALSAATADDYEYILLATEADPGTVTPPDGTWNPQFSVLNQAMDASAHIWLFMFDRISTGDTSGVTFTTGNSLFAAVLRGTLTGGPGSTTLLEAHSKHAAVSNSPDAVLTSARPGVVGAFDSLLAIIGEKTWADPGGSGAVAFKGPSDTGSGVIMNTQRIINYWLGAYLVPAADDPFSLGWTGGV